MAFECTSVVVDGVTPLSMEQASRYLDSCLKDLVENAAVREPIVTPIFMGFSFPRERNRGGRGGLQIWLV